MPPIRRLEAQLASVMPEPYRHWRKRREQQLAQLIQSPKAHVKAIQPLLRTCGLLPQSTLGQTVKRLFKLSLAHFL